MEDAELTKKVTSEHFCSCTPALQPLATCQRLLIGRESGPINYLPIFFTSLVTCFFVRQLVGCKYSNANLVTANTAPAHLHATGVAVYPALSFLKRFFLISSSVFRCDCQERISIRGSVCPSVQPSVHYACAKTTFLDVSFRNASL